MILQKVEQRGWRGSPVLRDVPSPGISLTRSQHHLWASQLHEPVSLHSLSQFELGFLLLKTKRSLAHTFLPLHPYLPHGPDSRATLKPRVLSGKGRRQEAGTALGRGAAAVWTEERGFPLEKQSRRSK